MNLDRYFFASYIVMTLPMPVQAPTITTILSGTSLSGGGLLRREIICRIMYKTMRDIAARAITCSVFSMILNEVMGW